MVVKGKDLEKLKGHVVTKIRETLFRKSIGFCLKGDCQKRGYIYIIE